MHQEHHINNSLSSPFFIFSSQNGFLNLASFSLSLNFCQEAMCKISPQNYWRTRRNGQNMEEGTLSGGIGVAASNIFCNETFSYIRLYQDNLGRILWGNRVTPPNQHDQLMCK